jgi:hypothetical protein
VPRTTSGVSRSRRYANHSEGGFELVRGGPRFDASHGSGNHRSLFEDLTPGTLRGLGRASLPGCGSRVRYDALDPELAGVGWGLGRAHGGRHVRHGATRCGSPPESAHGKRIPGQRPGGWAGRAASRTLARPPRTFTVDGTREDELRATERCRPGRPDRPNNRTCARGAIRARASNRRRRARR